MFDAKLRPLIDPPLNATGRWLAGVGVTANFLTFAGLVLGLGAAIVPYDMVAREIAAGDLLRIPGPALESRKRYFLVRPHGPVPEAVQKFERWLKKQLRSKSD